MAEFILFLSTVLQFCSAWLAYKLNRITGFSFGWVLLSGAVFVMAVRRTFSLISGLSGRQVIDASAEIIALSISMTMLLAFTILHDFHRKHFKKEESSSKDKLPRQSHEFQFDNKTLRVAAALIFILGITVICGWHLHIPLLLQIHPSFVPMQYNTALGFILSALCLTGLLKNHLALTVGSSVILLLLGCLTLLQYPTGVNLGIDELFMLHDLTEKTSHPGRMAPNSAVCFILTALFFILAHGKKTRNSLLPVLSASLLMSLSCVAFFGYLSDIETAHGWGKMTRMALHTSAGFIVIALGLLTALWKAEVRDQPIPHWTPQLIIVFGLTSTLVLMQAIKAENRKKLTNEVELHCSMISDKIQIAMEGQFKAMERMADRWNSRNGTPYNEWIIDATNYINHFSGFEYIKRLDSSFNVVHSVAHNESQEKGKFRKFAYNSKASLSLLPTESKKVVAVLPLFSHGSSDGFFAASYNLEELISSRNFLDAEENLLGVRLFAEDKELFRINYPENNDGLELSKELILADKKYTLRVKPGKKYIKNFHPEIYTVLLVLGLLTSLTISLISFFWLKLYDSEKELKVSDKKIKKSLKEIEKQKSELKKAWENAEVASQSKSEFLANMSHEIRTPLTAILGYLDLIKENKLEKKVLKDVKIIENNSRHLLTIINDILDLSKIEAGKLEIEMMPFSVFELNREIELLLRSKSREKGIDLIVDWQLPIPEQVASDPTRIRQVLLNLLGNSVKFTHKGYVKLETSWNRESSELVFRIKDSGIGMTGEQLEHIFESFQQADNSITRKYGGSGLGLTITERLTKMLNGRIAVASELNKGTEFTVTLKIENWGKLLHEKPKISSKSRTGGLSQVPLQGKVLLVDDNMTNLTLISKILKKMKLDVECCMNGQEALNLALKDKADFDLILMDVQMPVMDGLTAAAILKQNNYGKPVIALTANAMKGDKEKCLQAGYTDFATKPVNKNKLYAILDECLNETPEENGSE